MSWQNTWGTVKATNTKACALYHEVSNVGKTIEGSKKRVTWRLKVEEGKEYEISLTHSLASGKKVLRINGIVKYTAKAMSFGDWDYVFNLPGGHVVHIIIKPSVDLNDMYDLIIDGISFRRLPDRLDPSRKQPTDSQYIYTGEKSRAISSTTGPRATGSSGPSSRESSFTPWECQSCTLVNAKPFAPVCEACGDPKPAYVSPAAAARAKAIAEQRTPPRQQTKPVPKQADLLGTDTSSAFNAFGADAANAFGGDPFAKSNGFSSAPTATAPPPSAPTARPTPAKQDDIVSMLSGLDFTTAPTAPPPMANSFADFSKGPSSPNPADDSTADAHTVKTNGDLWDSKMVDLNLKGQHKLKPMNIKSGPSMEHERQKTGSFNTKAPVMPLPVQVPVMMAPTQPYYGAPPPATQQASPGYYQQPNMGGQYGTVAGYGGYNAMGMQPMAQQQQQQGFMTSAAPVGAPKQPAFYGADPFATLS